MTSLRRHAVLALSAALSLAACTRPTQPPAMNAADLSDDRGARAGRFLPPAANAVDANDSMADNATNESTP